MSESNKFRPDTARVADLNEQRLQETSTELFSKLFNLKGYLSFEPLENTLLKTEVKIIAGTVETHLDDLSGEYRTVSNTITHHEEGMRQVFSKAKGMFQGLTSEWQKDTALLKDLILRCQELAAGYTYLHALAIAADREMAAGMAWSHLRDWQIHVFRLTYNIYEMAIPKHCPGKPVSPLVNKGIEELERSFDSARQSTIREEDEGPAEPS